MYFLSWEGDVSFPFKAFCSESFMFVDPLLISLIAFIIA